VHIKVSETNQLYFAGDCEEGKENTMADNNQVNDATWNLIQSVQDTSKAIADTALSAQERNVAFAQSILENGIEVLRSNAESTRTLMSELTNRSQNQQGGIQEIVDNTLAIQERNTKYAQSVFENGIEVLKSQVGVTRNLIQELSQQAQKQQEAWQTLAHDSVDTYMNFFRAPFAFYQQIFDAAETATRQGLENFQNATRQGLENIQRATQATSNIARQGVEDMQKATQQAQNATQNAVNQAQNATANATRQAQSTTSKTTK
jgi:polyhydroxyalkanoate synthesis regulator phasin